MIGLLVSLGFETIKPIWAPVGAADEADSHVAFRGRFSSGAIRAELKILGVSEYLVWLDGKLIHNGPPRFAAGYPEYETVPLPLDAGSHLLAVHVRNEGVTTRIISQMKPFLWCSLEAGGSPISIDWKCARIPGYRPRSGRISDILGWTDWLDTRPVWPDWQSGLFDDSAWLTPIAAEPPKGALAPVSTGAVRLNAVPTKLIASGSLTTNYGYENDDPAVRFFLADLDPKDVPSQGVWRRYDLGRVRLGRPRITLDVPSGTVVEMALSESLEHGRVSPWITLSGSRSMNMDRFIARGGKQEFMPFTPKGGRFLEVHVLDPKAKFVREEFLERTYFGKALGSFQSEDALLNRIWETGVETVRACSEDAMVDCPTRERGQWTGDVASVASEIVGAAFGDLRLTRRALVQAAQAARADGLVAGVGPGDPGYLSTYAAQWITACVRYWEVTGDVGLLAELHAAARRNVAAFEAKRTGAGVSDDLGWAFVDWGYVRNEGPTDIALNLHYLMGIRSMIRWEKSLGMESKDAERIEREVRQTIETWLAKELGSTSDWSSVGYHRASLLLLAMLVPAEQLPACIAFIKTHLKSCFPNNPKGPRLSDPGFSNPRVMTPYFCHFSFAALLENRETDFVLGQFRKAWGWALDKGLTTWPEVFDLRWSHCHEWSGCPTWQLTHYVLGIQPRRDLGEFMFEIRPELGSLKRVSGTYPLGAEGSMNVACERRGRGLSVSISSSQKITARVGGRDYVVEGTKPTTIEISSD